MDIDKVKINPKYANEFPKMFPKEFGGFRNNIDTYGIREPIEVNDNDEIVDGHQRYTACKSLGHKQIPAVRKPFASEADALLYIDIINGQRRHLNKFQQIEHALKRKPEIQQKAKLNQSLGGKIKGRGLQICLQLLFV